MLLSRKHDFNASFTQFYAVDLLTMPLRSLQRDIAVNILDLEEAFDIYISRQNHEEIKEFVDAKGWWFTEGFFDSSAALEKFYVAMKL